jgi:hypothetical protein
MSKPKFTPGPWAISKALDNKIILGGDKKFPKVLAKIFIPHFFDKTLEAQTSAIKARNANARLIAAAPEMYKIMKIALTAHRCQPELKRNLKKITEVLSKIDGEA